MATASAIPMIHPRVSDLMVRLINSPGVPHAQLMTISPEDARGIMEHRNPRNRHLGLDRRNSLAETLKAGLWRVNGETVIFGSNGNLLDGQGRLAACGLADVPLETYVVFGVDPAAFDSIDRGKRRNLSDDLAIDGEQNTTTLAAALCLVWLWEQGQLDRAGQVAQVPSQVARNLLQEHPGLRTSAREARATSRVLKASIGAFCHYRFAGLDAEEADAFFEDLRTGAGLPLNDPALVLRNRLLNGRAEHERIPERESICLVTKAWNARRQGREIKLLQFKPTESIPEPV